MFFVSVLRPSSFGIFLSVSYCPSLQFLGEFRKMLMEELKEHHKQIAVELMADLPRVIDCHAIKYLTFRNCVKIRSLEIIHSKNLGIKFNCFLYVH